MPSTRRIDVRAFMEGVEIPVVSAVIQIVPNAPAMCTLQIVATDRVLQFYDRTIVHVFFKDLFDTDANIKLEDYRLAYIGEVRTIQLSKQPGSRSAFVQLEDLSAYWDQCMQYVGNYASGGDGFWDRTSSFIGANKALFDNILRTVELQISNLVNSKSVTRPETKGLLSGVLRLMERMGGVYTGTQPFRGQNDFYSSAELRLRMVDQIGAPEKDTTSARMVRNKTFINWITNSMGSYGSLISYRDILKILFQFIFYESCPNPMAKFNGPSTRTETKYSNIAGYERVQNKSLYDRVSRLRRLIQDFIEKETNGNRLVQFRAAATGIAFPTDLPRGLLNTAQITPPPYIKTLQGERIASLVASAIKFARTLFGSDTKGGLSDKEAARISGNNTKAVKAMLAAIREIEGGSHDGMLREMGKVLQYYDSGVQVSVPGRRVAKRTQRVIPSNLYTQLMYPNLYFAPPPKCNVIFPEQQISFQFMRDMRKEVTRMRIQLKHWLSGSGSTKGAGRGKLGTSLLGIYYYAPEILGIRKRTYLGSNHGFARVLLPHERFSGIIPTIKTMGRVNFYVARKDQDYKERGGGIPYVQKTANFLFFLDRYAARKLSIVGPFNPNIVCGLPAVALDRYSRATVALPYNRAELDPTKGKRPTQFLGRVAQIVHTLSQSQQTTSYSLTTVRTHDEKVELIGAGELDKLKRKTVDSTRVKRMTQLKVESEDLATRLTTLRNTSTEDFTLAKQKRTFKSLADHADEIRKSAESARLTQASKAAMRTNTAILEAERHLAADRTLNSKAHLQHAITMISQVASYIPGKDKLDPAQVPAEEVLRPPWYDPLFDNNRIGKDFYQPLIGCDSIVDMTAIKQQGSDREYPTQTAATVKHAVDQLVETYGSMRRTEGAAVSFVNAYTQRPIATLDQVIGEEGFHRHAFGDATAFEDILRDPLLGVENANATIKKISPDMDVRAERRRVIIEYVRELEDGVLLG